MAWTLFLPVFSYLLLNGEIERSSGCLAQNNMNIPLTHTPFSPTPTQSHVSTKDHCATWERTEEGVWLWHHHDLGVPEKMPSPTAAQLTALLPGLLHWTCRFPFHHLQKTSTCSKHCTSLSFTYENLADQTFMPLASLSSPFPLLFALRANWRLFKDDLNCHCHK